jgi:hypothetical protein
MVTSGRLSSEVFSNALRKCTGSDSGDEAAGFFAPKDQDVERRKVGGNGRTSMGQGAFPEIRLASRKSRRPGSMAAKGIAFLEDHQRSVAYLDVDRQRFGIDESSEGLQPRTKFRRATEFPFAGGTEHLETSTLQSAVEGITSS